MTAFSLYLLSVFIDVRATMLDIIIPYFIMACGLGLAMAQRTATAANSVSREEVGEVSSLLALVRNLAGAFGIAIFGTILQDATNSSIFTVLQNSTLYVHTPEATSTFIALLELKAQIMGYQSVFIASTELLIFSACITLLVKIPEKKR